LSICSLVHLFTCFLFSFSLSSLVPCPIHPTPYTLPPFCSLSLRPFVPSPFRPLHPTPYTLPHILILGHI
jgi:hypothetical protein